MSAISRSIYDANPGTFDATAPGVAIGDLVIDPANLNGVGIVVGPNSGRTVQPLGGGLPLQLSTVSVSTPVGAPSTKCNVVANVTDPGPNTPIDGAIVQLLFQSASVLVGAVGNGDGTVLASVLDANDQFSLLVVGRTGLGGKVELEVTGTAGANFNYSATVLFPLPSFEADTGAFTP